MFCQKDFKDRITFVLACNDIDCDKTKDRSVYSVCIYVISPADQTTKNRKDIPSVPSV